MQFIRESSNKGAEKLQALLLGELKHGKTVLWMLSGGSNIQISVDIMKKLLGNEENLIITLVDERYGSVGHKDSNWQQLIAAGFKAGKATTYPILQEGLSLQATARMFDLTLQDCFENADKVVAQLGIGPDGHTSGILPHTPATQAKAGLAFGYQTEQYERVTTTFDALVKIDDAFCFAYGADKKPALLDLKKSLTLNDQPAQILKAIKNVYLYNDQIDQVGQIGDTE